MCDFVVFLKDLCLSSIDSAIDSHTGDAVPRFTGVLLEVIVFLVCFHLMCNIGEAFMGPAFESLSLRKGAAGGVVASVFVSITLSTPEVAISFMSAIKGEYSSNHSLAISTILGSGWITYLLVPGLIGLRSVVEVPLIVIARDLGFYGLLCIALHQIIADGTVSVYESLLLLGIYGGYFLSLVRTHLAQHAVRRHQRENRLLIQLAPLQSAVSDIESLERLPLQMINQDGALDLPVSGYSPVATREDDGVGSYVHPFQRQDSFTTRLVSVVCVRALPGTDTERYYSVSLINAFLLQLLLSAVVTAVSGRWIDLVAKGTVSRPNILGSVVVALSSQLTDILLAVTASTTLASLHVFTNSVSSQIFAISVGLGLPWLVNALVHGSTQIDKAAVSTNLVTTFVVLATFVTYCLFNFRSGKLQNSKMLLAAYLVVVIGFISVSV